MSKITVKDLKNPYVLLATWFGCGLVPKAPGTWGSIGALPTGIALFHFAGFEVFIAAIIVVHAVGWFVSREFETLSGEHDSKMIVIDEVAGQWIALLPAFMLTGLMIAPILISLALFRFFDVLKPGPIRWIDQNVNGASGVMFDDTLAGIFAALVLWGILTYV